MKKIIALFLVMLVASCSSTKPNFYQPIGVRELDVSYKDFKDTIRVSNVILPNLVARPQITTLGEDDYSLEINEFNRWGSNLDKLIQQAINVNLSNIFTNAMVENQSAIRKDYKYDVAIEINDLTGRLDEFAKLDASYFIRNKNGKIIKSKNFYKAKAFEGGYDKYVKTISIMLGDLSQAIANDIVNLK